MSMLQLDPMIPVYSVDHDVEGYAFAIIDYSQEHHLLFVVGLDNGEIWTIPNSRVRMAWNPSLDRKAKPDPR